MELVGYSSLLFHPQIEKDVEELVISLLCGGKKVYFYTFDKLDDLKNIDFIYKAAKNGLLRMDTVRYDPEWDGEPINYNDGKAVNEAFLTYLEKNSSFNKEQYELEHANQVTHCIVKAGAGTGKTTTMIDRLMYLKHLDEELSLENVVMITFTNEAAVHMRMKVIEKLRHYYEVTKDPRYLIWTEEVARMFIGTIHAYSKEFLVSEGEKLGFHRGLKVRSYRYERRKQIQKELDQFSMMNSQVYNQFKHIPHYQLVSAIDRMIEKLYNKSIPLNEVFSMNVGEDTSQFHTLSKTVIYEVLAELQRRKRQEDSLEIYDLIAMLKNVYGEVRDQNLSIQYLFVDEFQDTDESQVSFISWLASTYRCQLFAVGDVKQSIYRFRGADYTAFTQLKEQLEHNHEVVRDYALQKNYRSAPILLSQFNTLFTKWDRRIEEFQFLKNDELLAGLQDKKSEGIVGISFDRSVLQRLLERLHKKNVAVLVRSNGNVKEMVERIEAMGYFCEASIEGSFYRSLPVREFYLLVRSLTHRNVPKDQYLFHQSIYGKNDLSIKEILHQFTYDEPYVLKLVKDREEDLLWAKDISALMYLEKHIKEKKPHRKHAQRLYASLRQQFPDQSEEMQRQEALVQMKEYEMNVEYLLYLLKKEFGDFQATLYDIEQFLSIKMATDRDTNSLTLEKDVSHRIKVMTVHKSKGLEFDYVLLPMIDSQFIREGRTEVILFPKENRWHMGYHISWKDKTCRNSIYDANITSENKETIAEETRLLYVALTRAKENVYVNTQTTMKAIGTFNKWSDLLEGGEHLNVSSSLFSKH